MIKKTFEVGVEIYQSLEELSPTWQKLWEEATKACQFAYAPYSNFWVGAAILLKGGQIVQGVNQENAAYPSGLCAERVAFYRAGIQFPNTSIEKIAIAARRAEVDAFIPVTPCGACRQVMIEFENKQEQLIEILFKGGGNEYFIIRSVSDLLPLQFNAESLGI
jgi:cytidine deaminase